VTTAPPAWRAASTSPSRSGADLHHQGDAGELPGRSGKGREGRTESAEFKNLVDNSGLEIKFKGYTEFSKFFEEQKALTAQLMKEINAK
jgi:hypothetical protein